MVPLRATPSMSVYHHSSMSLDRQANRRGESWANRAVGDREFRRLLSKRRQIFFDNHPKQTTADSVSSPSSTTRFRFHYYPTKSRCLHGCEDDGHCPALRRGRYQGTPDCRDTCCKRT